MDLKGVFEECVRRAEPSASSERRPHQASSLFIIQAETLKSTLKQFSEFCIARFDEYSSYHQGMKSFSASIDPIAFDAVTSRFVVDTAVEMKDLQAKKNSMCSLLPNGHSDSHYSAVLTSLMQDLQELSRTLDAMQQERRKYTQSCLRLHSDITDMAADSAADNTDEHAMFQEGDRANPVLSVQSKFSARYEAEIAHPKQMQQYQTFFEEHKELLAVENKDLHKKFSDELNEAHAIEQSVHSIAYLLNDFSRILETQSGGAEEVLADSKAASEYVSGAEEQLILTIERSKSSQRSMVIITIGLSILLLLLDYLTP